MKWRPSENCSSTKVWCWFRNQPLDRQRHERIGAIIAEIVREGDQVFISNINPDDVFKNERLAYHYDNYYSPHPHVVVSLQAIDVTPGASTTRFANTVRTFAAMTADLQSELRGYEVLNILTSSNSGRNYLRDQPKLDGCVWPQRVWPMIARHPTTGEPFIAAMENLTDSVVGKDFEDSEAILASVFGAIYSPSQIYEHQWADGDVIFWDNFPVQHGRPEVAACERRVLRRVSIGGKGFFEMHGEVARQLSRYAAQ